MGNNNSLLPEGFTREEVQFLRRRFKKLDADRSGTVTVQEITGLPEFKSNPMVRRVLEVFDKDKSGEVDFNEFISGLSNFCVSTSHSSQDRKLRFLFDIYDVDQDGLISADDLLQALKAMVGKNLADHQLQSVAARCILYNDKDGDDKIDFDEFSKLVQSRGLEGITEKLAIDLQPFLPGGEREG